MLFYYASCLNFPRGSLWYYYYDLGPTDIFDFLDFIFAQFGRYTTILWWLQVPFMMDYYVYGAYTWYYRYYNVTT